MDDTLRCSESSKKLSATEWHLGTESDISLGAGSARFSLQQNLHVLPTKELEPKKSFIPASLMEKLSFLSAYTSTTSKIEILCMQQNNVNRQCDMLCNDVFEVILLLAQSASFGFVERRLCRTEH
ncbi:unnamed protein product, partial [Brenthis ino]